MSRSCSIGRCLNVSRGIAESFVFVSMFVSLVGMRAAHAQDAADPLMYGPLPPNAKLGSKPILGTSQPLVGKSVPLIGGAVPLIGGGQGLVGSAVSLAGKLKGLENGSGQIEVGESDLGTKITLQSEFLFDFDKSVLKPAAFPTLREIANTLAKGKIATMLLRGHTDSKGSDQYNLQLSQRRADAVRNWFVKEGGLRSIQMRVEALGEAEPIAPNQKPDGTDDPAGREKNRRVELFVK